MVKKKYNYARYSKAFLYIGSALLIFAILYAFVFFVNYVIFATSDPMILQWMLGFFSGGIGVLSIGIAFHSADIANKSDEKMKAIANADFFELAYRFWEKAPELYKPLDFPSRDTCSWHLVNYFNHADKLKKWADPDIQERLINALKTFLERLRIKTCKKFWVEIKNYMSACNIAIGFKADNEIKDELIDELGNWIGKKEGGESKQEYLQRKNNELSKMKKRDIF